MYPLCIFLMMYLVDFYYYGGKWCYQIVTPSMGFKANRIPKDIQPEIIDPEGRST